MRKKLFFPLIGFVLLAFLFSSIVSAPLIAQEQEEEAEDVMDMDLEDLLNVEITTAGKKAEKISDIPASVVLITRADIERYGYDTLDEILENVPGLYGLDQRDVAGLVLGVRGFWSAYANSIIFLINGVRQERMASDGATYMAQYIPVEAIDRIEVIRGPMSVIYGPGAFFGAINIITNDAKEDEKGLVSVSYGSMQTVRAAVRAAYKKDDLSLVFNAGVYDSKGPDEPYDRMASYPLTDFTMKTTTKDRWINGIKFFNLSGSFKGFYANMTFNLNKRGLDIFFPAWDEGARATRTYSSISFGYKEDFSEKFSLDGKFTYHKGSTRSDWDWFTIDQLNIGGDFNYREDYEMELNAYFTPSDKLNVTTGLFYRKIIYEQLETYMPLIDYGYRLGLLDPVISQAWFLQADFIPSKKFKLVAGLRLEQSKKYTAYFRGLIGGVTGTEGEFEHDKIEFIPRVAAIFRLNEKNIIKLLYGKAINVPSFFQTAGQVAAGRSFLEPEYIQTFEINYLAALSEKFTVNLSAFYNDFDNLIINTPFLDPDLGAYIGVNLNAGKMTTIGAELSIQAKPSDKFILELSGTYQKTEDKREGFKDIDVAYSPEILAYFKLAYAFSKNTGFAITGRYVGSMEAFYDGVIGDRIADAVDGYFSLGANLRFNNLFGKGYFLNVHCSNLLDDDYLFPSFTLNGNWADKGLIGYGRMIMVTFGKKF